MAATLIDGKEVSFRVLEDLRKLVATQPDRPPGVAFVRVGEDPASVYYVASKQKTATHLGIVSRLRIFPESISQDALLAEIDELNRDPAIHGILVQSPLPAHIDERTVFDRVDPRKDVDGLGSRNLGLLCQEDDDAFTPCTPTGILELLGFYNIATDGAHAVVVGRSLLVGKTLALLLSQKKPSGNATVTLCHSRTRDLSGLCRQADILIAALGRPAFVKQEMVKPGATVIDVGINHVAVDNRKGYQIVGDVDFDPVSAVAGKITPVPGGVGPMTVAMLMKNTIKAWQQTISTAA